MAGHHFATIIVKLLWKESSVDANSKRKVFFVFFLKKSFDNKQNICLFLKHLLLMTTTQNGEIESPLVGDRINITNEGKKDINVPPDGKL